MTGATTNADVVPDRATAAQAADAEGKARGKALLWVSLFGIALKGIGVLAAFASQLILARVLGVEAFGVYVTVVACATVLGLVAGLGLPLASVRFLASCAEQGDWPRYRGFLWTSIRLIVVSSLVIGAIVIAVFAAMPSLRPMLPAMAVGVPMILLLSGSSLASGAFLAAQQPLQAEAFGNVSRPFLVIALVGGAAITGPSVSAEMALLMTVCAGGLVLVTQAIGLRPVLARHWRGARETDAWRAWLASGAAFVLSTAAYSMVERIDTILLGTMVSPAVAAPYSVASRLALLVGIALAPVSAMLGPMGAQLLTRGDLRGLQRVLGQGALISTVLGGVLTIALLALSPLLLGLFGKEFTAGHGVLVILVISQVVLAMVGPAGFILAIAGHNRLLVTVSLLTALLDLVLCAILIPRHGAVGAGIATSVSISLNGLALAAITWWKVRVDTTLLTGIALLFRPKERPA